MSLSLCPITLSEACYYVAAHHRHHPAPQGGLFAVGVASAGKVVGVAIQTVHEAMAPGIERAYSTGQMPPLLPGATS